MADAPLRVVEWASEVVRVADEAGGSTVVPPIEIRLLGDVAVLLHGREVVLGTRRQRALLALLALARGALVPADELVTALWQDAPARRGTSLLRPLIGNLRRVLDDDAMLGGRSRILTRSPGYSLAVAPEDIDAVRAEIAAVELANLLDARRFEDAVRVGEAALAMWRGPALGDLASEHFAATAAVELDRLRSSIEEQTATARVALLGPGAAGKRTPVGVAVPAARPPVAAQVKALAVAERALADVAGGQLRVLVISGDAGIGKSRLVDDVAQLASARGFKVAAGYCDDDGTPPFGPWNDVLTAVGAGSVESLRPTVDVLEVEAGHRRLLDAVVGRLRAAAADQPLMVVLEDLHWADRSSLACLERLVRHDDAAGVFVVATVRDPAGDAVSEVLGGLVRRTPLRRIDLEGLGRADVEALALDHAGRPLTRHELDQVVERARGNPFFAIELARWLRDHGVDDGGVPVTIAAVVRRRLAVLPARATDLLVAASIIGRTFELDVLAATTTFDRDELFDLVDLVVIHHLLEPAPDRAAAYRFVHALTRDAILHRLPAGERARLHHAVAGVLDTPSRLHPDLAVHRWEARFLDPEAARAACEAAAMAAATAHAVADEAMWWERALQLEPHGSPGRARVLLRLGAALGHAGPLTDAHLRPRRDGGTVAGVLDLDGPSPREASRTYLVAAIETSLAVGDHATAVTAAESIGSEWIATHWTFRTTAFDAVGAVRSVLERVPPEQVATRSRLLGNIANGVYCDADTELSDDLSAEALDLARRDGDAALLAGALLTRALAVHRPGRDTEIRARLDELLALDGLSAEHESAALLMRSAVELRNGRRPSAEADLRRAEDIAAAARLVWADRQAQIVRHAIALTDGDTDAAEAILGRLHRHGRDRASGGAARIGFMMLVGLRLAQGRLHELEAGARAIADHLPVARVDALGPVLLACGRRDEVAAMLNDPEAIVAPPQDWFWFVDVALRGLVAVGLGDRQLADDVYTRVRPHAGTLLLANGFVNLGLADQLLGDLARTRGEHAAAAAHFRAATELARRIGAEHWRDRAAACLADLGIEPA